MRDQELSRQRTPSGYVALNQYFTKIPKFVADQGINTRRIDTEWIVATVVFVLALTLYVATMCRTVFWWDTGELAANANILGIAHRPGFPLYVVVGRLFCLIPFGDIFYRINFLSALTAAVALAVLAKTWLCIGLDRLGRLRVHDVIVAVALALMAVAGTYTYWMQAVRAEVYAPTLLILAIILACARQCERGIRRGDRSAARWMVAAAFLGGLGLGLHNATLASTMPAVLVFFIVLNRRGRFGPGSWLTAVLAFAVGLSIYLYLPIRATMNPALNWGWATIDPAPGWRAVVATDAWGVLSATQFSEWSHRFWLSCKLLFAQWELGLIVVAAAGCIHWWRSAPRWLWLVIGIGFGNLAMTAFLVTDFTVTNADIHGYLLPTLVSMGFLLLGGIRLLVGGIRNLAERFSTASLRPFLVSVVTILLLMLAAAPGLINLPYCNLISHHLAYDYGTEATASLKPGAVVILSGTNTDFVLRGLQYCDNWRPDLKILNRDLLPAAWYRHWAMAKFPELAAHPIPRDSSGLHVRQWAQDLAAAGIPVYWEFMLVDVEIADRLIPAGHLFEVTPEPVPQLGADLLAAQEDFERNSRFYSSSERILYDFDAQRVYVVSLYRAGTYYEARGLFDRARDLYQRALSLGQEDNGMPNDPPPGSKTLGDLKANLLDQVDSPSLDRNRQSP